MMASSTSWSTSPIATTSLPATLTAATCLSTTRSRPLSLGGRSAGPVIAQTAYPAFTTARGHALRCCPTPASSGNPARCIDRCWAGRWAPPQFGSPTVVVVARWQFEIADDRRPEAPPRARPSRLPLSVIAAGSDGESSSSYNLRQLLSSRQRRESRFRRDHDDRTAGLSANGNPVGGVG